MKTLVTMGRGGTGKTSFVALMTKYFIEKKDTPLLLVDVDPDQNLAEMVGVDLESAGKRTISELLVETFIDRGGTSVGIPPTERIEGRIWEKGVFESDNFDLIAVGTKWAEGCYCLPDAALKGALGAILKNYRYILIDSPAGLEHLNRRITTKVDEVFDVIGPSKKSFDHVKRAVRIAKEVRIDIKKFSIIGGFLFPEHLDTMAKKTFHEAYLGRIAYDKNVEEFVLAGNSLLNLPKNAPAYLSLKRIMEKAGYISL